jgi:hypothetical protein
MRYSSPRRAAAVCTGAAALLLLVPITAEAQLRVATWNISNYNDTSPTAGRSADLKTAIYGTFQNRSMAPDVFLGQEFQSEAAAANFVKVLNSDPNSPGDWAMAPFYAGATTGAGESDSAFFYRASKINYLGTARVAQSDGTTADQPRDTLRFDVALRGYAGAAAAPQLSIYSVHMKAGSTGDDQARRLIEAQRIHDDARSLPVGRQYLIGGDFNVQNSNQSAYAKLVGTTGGTGPFNDPINTPGAWNNNPAYKFVHTQDPYGPVDSGMDDRHDQILLGTGLVDGKGFDYIGDATKAYSTTTWNDPNHSYRAWGNDGTSYDQDLTTTGNAMVGGSIAAALKNVATAAGGHLPIFLDARRARGEHGDDQLRRRPARVGRERVLRGLQRREREPLDDRGRRAARVLDDGQRRLRRPRRPVHGPRGRHGQRPPRDARRVDDGAEDRDDQPLHGRRARALDRASGERRRRAGTRGRRTARPGRVRARSAGSATRMMDAWPVAL